MSSPPGLTGGVSGASSIASGSDEDSLLNLETSGTGLAERTFREVAVEQSTKAVDLAGRAALGRTLPSATSLRTMPSLVTSVAASSAWSDSVAASAPPNYAEATASRSAHRPSDVDDVQSMYDAQSHDGLLDSWSERGGKKSNVKRFHQRQWVVACCLNWLVYSVVVIVNAWLFRPSGKIGAHIEEKMDLYPIDHPFHKSTRRENFHHNLGCKFANIPDYRIYGFANPVNFSIIETIETPDYHRASDFKVSGRVDIRPAPYNQDLPIRIYISTATTRNWPLGLPDVDFSSRGIQIRYPEPPYKLFSGMNEDTLRNGGHKRLAASGSECLDFWVGVYVKTSFQNLEIHTENLQIDSDLPDPFKNQSWFHLQVREDTRISSRRGDIKISNLDSRRACVFAEEGSIKANFKLNDELSLETAGNGSISVGIEQIAAPMAGYVDTRPPKTSANFTTRTSGGSQAIVHEQTDGLEWARHIGYGYPFLLNSSHSSVTGSIDIKSISYWEGELMAESTNGVLKVTGNELEPINDDLLNIGGPQKFHARRGSEKSKMNVQTNDGDVDICIGIWECLYPFLDT